MYFMNYIVDHISIQFVTEELFLAGCSHTPRIHLWDGKYGIHKLADAAAQVRQIGMVFMHNLHWRKNLGLELE